MLRATMTQPGAIRFEDVPLPVAGPEQILVRVRRIGVCGSDIHVYHGKHPYTSYPVVQGHEFSAEVVGGDGELPGGTLVTAPPQITCGECLACRNGQYHICEKLKVMGFQAPGVAQEYFALPKSEVIRLPGGFTPEMGATRNLICFQLSRAARWRGEHALGIRFINRQLGARGRDVGLPEGRRARPRLPLLKKVLETNAIRLYHG